MQKPAGNGCFTFFDIVISSEKYRSIYQLANPNIFGFGICNCSVSKSPLRLDPFAPALAPKLQPEKIINKME